MSPVTLTFNFATADEALAFLSHDKASHLVAAPSTEAAAPPAVKEPAKGKGKSASTEATAPGPSPVVATKATESAASVPAPSPAPQAEPVAYEKTGIPEAFAEYLGGKESTGYAQRRLNVIDLLKAFGVARGPELKPTQFADFKVALDKLKTPETEDSLG